MSWVENSILKKTVEKYVENDVDSINLKELADYHGAGGGVVALVYVKLSWGFT